MLSRNINMRRRLILYITIQFIVVGFAKAQLPVQFSQVFKTLEFVNPAYTAFEGSFTGKLINRSQWGGMEGAPKVYGLSVYSPLKNYKLGVGGNLITVSQGSMLINNASLLANVDLRINETDYLALGIQAGIEYSFFDRDKVISYYEVDVTDPSFAAYDDIVNYTFVNPTAGCGLIYYNPSFYAGASSFLMLNRNDIVSDIDFYLGSYLTAGYVYELNYDWRIKGSGLYKLMNQFENTWEVGAQFLYLDALWLGTAYRHKEAQIFMVDVKLTDEVRLGLSYDAVLSELKRFTYGSFEMRLEYRMKMKRNSSRYKRKMFYMLN